MKSFKQILASILIMVMLLSSSVNMTVNAGEAENVTKEAAATERIEDEVIDTETAEVPSVVTERGMQFKIENLQDVKSIRYAYGDYDNEKDIKYGIDSVSHSAKTLRTRGDSCTLQFTKPGLVSIVVTYNDGTRDFHKYEVIKSSPTVTRDGGNNITFENLNDLKVLRYVKGEYDSSYDIKRAYGSVAVSGKTLDSDTYTATLDRETYTFCVQYNDESYNYYVTGVCGDNLTWVYDMQSATLTISGEGEMKEYTYGTIPWINYASETKVVKINHGIISLSSDAFAFFELLDCITLPSTLKSIGGGTFWGCNSLKSVIIPDSVTYLGSFVFNECSDLESVIMGNGIEEIWPCAFSQCYNLKNVVFGTGVKSIYDYAFEDCISLNDIKLPDSVMEIGMLTFSGTGYYKNKDNWENNLLYLDDHLIDTKSKLGTCIIKDGTKSIASYAFEDAVADVIYIPESVEFIALGGLMVYNHNSSLYDEVLFKVVRGSYAEQYLMQTDYNFSYFDPAEIYG